MNERTKSSLGACKYSHEPHEQNKVCVDWRNTKMRLHEAIEVLARPEAPDDACTHRTTIDSDCLYRIIDGTLEMGFESSSVVSNWGAVILTPADFVAGDWVITRY